MKPLETVPLFDHTEQAFADVARLLGAFEHAAAAATSPARCRQLHERLLACTPAMMRADDDVRARWEALLAKDWEE